MIKSVKKSDKKLLDIAFFLFNNQVIFLNRRVVMRSLVVCIFVLISSHAQAVNTAPNSNNALANFTAETPTSNDIIHFSSINSYFNLATFSYQSEISVPLFNKDEEFTFFSQAPFQRNAYSDTATYYHNLIFTHQKSLFKPELFQIEDKNQVALHYLHLGQNTPLTTDQTTWFYSGAGFTYFDSESGVYQDDMALSFSVGIHSQYSVNKRFSVNIDSKLYGTYFDGQTNNYCVNDICQLNIENDVWLQKQISVKVNYIF